MYLLSELINIQLIIIFNIFINWYFLDESRLVLFKNNELIMRTIKFYILVIFIEEFLFNIEKMILNNLLVENADIFIAIFHTGLYFFSNKLYMPLMYCILNSFCILGFLLLKNKFDILNGLILHIYYKSFSLFMLHTAASY